MRRDKRIDAMYDKNVPKYDFFVKGIIIARLAINAADSESTEKNSPIDKNTVASAAVTEAYATILAGFILTTTVTATVEHQIASANLTAVIETPFTTHLRFIVSPVRVSRVTTIAATRTRFIPF